MINYFAPILKDAYKIYHPTAYLEGTEQVFSNYTNRFGKYTNVPGLNRVVSAGILYFVKAVLIEAWNTTFFNRPKEDVLAEYSRIVNSVLGKEVDLKYIDALHDLGYLPIEVRSLPEGVLVPYGVPTFTVESTVDGFGWCANAIESCISSEVSGISTSATTAFGFRMGFERMPVLRELGFIKFMGHDFSYRGMLGGSHHAAMSGFGHAMSFLGSDTLPVIPFAEKYYNADVTKAPVVMSVDATEHSVACSNIIIITEMLESGELEIPARFAHIKDLRLVAEGIYMLRLMTEVTPTGPLSLVCDSFEFWAVMELLLPALKDVIEARDGAVVIRPDSGDPVDVLCGKDILIIPSELPHEDVESYLLETLEAELRDKTPHGTFGGSLIRIVSHRGYVLEVTLTPNWNRHDKQFYYMEPATVEDLMVEQIILSTEQKGLMQYLIELFGSSKVAGLDVLNPCVGAIYGDSITIERQSQIHKRLIAKGIAPTPILGVGSFSYQYVTRDTHGSAIKATNIKFKGRNIAITKDPKTDSTKKSAKGLLMVVIDKDTGDYVLKQDVTRAEFVSDVNQLVPLFKNSELLRDYSLEDLRANIDGEVFKLLENEINS